MVRRAASDAPKTPDEATEPADAVEAAKQVFGDDIVAIGGIYVGDDGQPLGLYARIAKITEDLPTVEPEGENDHFKYKFLTINQITGLLRPRMARQKILVFPETVVEEEPRELTTKRGGTSLLTRLHVTFRVVDAINGESFTLQVIGYGDDASDKGANKAYTAALKNMLIKLFLIGGEDDLEADEEADKRAKARDAGSERVRDVEIGDTEITGVKRGGRSEKATDAQVARVGQYIRDLELTPEAVVAFVDKVLGDSLELGEKPWEEIKSYLEGLSGPDIGKLVARFDAVLNQAEETTRDRDDDDPTNNYG